MSRRRVQRLFTRELHLSTMIGIALPRMSASTFEEKSRKDSQQFNVADLHSPSTATMRRSMNPATVQPNLDWCRFAYTYLIPTPDSVAG